MRSGNRVERHGDETEWSRFERGVQDLPQVRDMAPTLRGWASGHHVLCFYHLCFFNWERVDDGSAACVTGKRIYCGGVGGCLDNSEVSSQRLNPCVCVWVVHVWLRIPPHPHLGAWSTSDFSLKNRFCNQVSVKEDFFINSWLPPEKFRTLFSRFPKLACCALSCISCVCQQVKSEDSGTSVAWLQNSDLRFDFNLRCSELTKNLLFLYSSKKNEDFNAPLV